jgi:replicative DNA helicase
MGYAADGDVDEIVNSAQAEIYAVTEQRTSEDYLPLGDIMEGALDEIEAIGSRSGEMTGVPTGFTDFDSLTNGLHPGQMIVIAARPAMGKALALDTALPTPTGWTTMGAVEVGDHLIAADGSPTRVVAATDVMVDRPCYQVTFDDGTTVIADADHQWLTWDRDRCTAYEAAASGTSPFPENWPSWPGAPSATRPHAPGEGSGPHARHAAGLASVHIADLPGGTAEGVQQQMSRSTSLSNAPMPRTTIEIAHTLRVRGEWNHAIPAAEALSCPEGEVPIDPYVLGCLLGADGATEIGWITCDPQDREWLIKECEAAGFETGQDSDECGAFDIRAFDDRALDGRAFDDRVFVHGLRDVWRSLGRGAEAGRQIPPAYLRASVAQRLALAQGLIDVAGHVDGDGAYRFRHTDRVLVEGVRELVTTLGCVPRLHRRIAVPAARSGAEGHGADSWEVVVPTGLALARVPRKRHTARQRWNRGRLTRYVTAVTPVRSVPVRCVQVDNPDHLYLATDAMVPTHNSTLALDFARAASIKNNLPSVIFSLEMGRNEIAMRLLSAEARVALHHMRSGTMTDDDWTRLARRMPEVTAAPLYIDDSPNLSMMEIRAKCRRLKQRNDLKLVVIDYLQLMQSGGSRRAESRQQEVSDMSRNLKLLAKELEVPVIALSQLNRGPEQRTDKKPMVSDLRESGSIEQDADMVILLHREDAYEKESPRAGEADLIVAKHRNGPTATITVAFQGHYSRFVDMAGT